MGDCVEGNFLNKSLPKAPFELPSFTTNRIERELQWGSRKN